MGVRPTVRTARSRPLCFFHDKESTMMSNWLNNLRRLLLGQPRRARGKRPAPGRKARLCVEHLETRLTPNASLTITGTGIVFDDSSASTAQTLTLTGSTSGFTLTSTVDIIDITNNFSGSGSFTGTGTNTVTFSGSTNQFTSFAITMGAANDIIQIGN